VLRGKSDELVVKVAGVLAGQSAQTANRAAIHLAKSTGLADATHLGDVLRTDSNFAGGSREPK
jgi:hypothetical protein